MEKLKYLPGFISADSDCFIVPLRNDETILNIKGGKGWRIRRLLFPNISNQHRHCEERGTTTEAICLKMGK